MTKFMQPSFSINVGGPEYADGWDRTFGPKDDAEEVDLSDLEVLSDNDAQPVKDFIATQEPTVTYRPMYARNTITVPASQAPGWAVERWKEESERASKRFRQLIDEARYDNAIVNLDDYQKRQVAWAEHNFPVKATEEHHRIAVEQIARIFDWDPDEDIREVYPREIKDLAYLLATRERGSWQPLLGAVEEIGELCHAHLKNAQGIRGTPEHWRAKKQDAVGDVLVYLMDYCSREGFSVTECLETAWAEVSRRDWQRYPKNGTSE